MQAPSRVFCLYLAATLLALCVIVLGAYVRLSDAGLGCPDWPGCYGKLLVSETLADSDKVKQMHAQRPLETAKAWKEMIHRYAAGILGLLILALALHSWFLRLKGLPSAVLVPTALLLLVIFQAALGMWTVTLLLKPVIVTAHLLGGMIILALLYWQLMNTLRPAGAFVSKGMTPLAVIAVLVLFCQIALGGWTSANYSALVCTDFPTCQGKWWPPMDFKEGFTLWRGLGIDYEGGVLDAPARTAVHVSHRLGALLTSIVVLVLGASALWSKNRRLQQAGMLLVIALLAQVSLGIANVLLVLPLPLAVAHNGVAALLLLSMITLLYFCLAGDSKTGA